MTKYTPPIYDEHYAATKKPDVQASECNDLLGVAADDAAYSLARALEDLIELAGTAMREANADGSEWEVEEELACARLALRTYKAYSAQKCADTAPHACGLNRAYDGTCLICEN